MKGLREAIKHWIFGRRIYRDLSIGRVIFSLVICRAESVAFWRVEFIYFRGFKTTTCTNILIGRFGEFRLRRNKEAWRSDLKGLEEIFIVIDWPSTTKFFLQGIFLAS